MHSSAGFIIITSAFRFSVHTNADAHSRLPYYPSTASIFRPNGVADGPPQRIRDKGQQHLPGDEASRYTQVKL